MADILIIEDDKKINELIRRTLSMTGHQGLTAFSGREALLSLEQKRADQILLDMYAGNRKDGGCLCGIGNAGGF